MNTKELTCAVAAMEFDLSQIRGRLEALEGSALAFCSAGREAAKEHPIDAAGGTAMSKRKDSYSKANRGCVPYFADPDYASFLSKARIIARQDGYALAVHGSAQRDLDVIAVPWVADPRQPIHLVTRIAFGTGLTIQTNEPTVREHGRLVWCLLFPVFGDPRYVDVSVISPHGGRLP